MDIPISDLHSQRAREQDYAHSAAFKGKSDGRELFRFFSPYIVPEGLTDDEICACVAVAHRRETISDRLSDEHEEKVRLDFLRQLEDDYILLEQQRELLSLVFGPGVLSATPDQISRLYAGVKRTQHNPVPLPDEFTQSPMTRELFAAGMEKLLKKITELEASLR